MEITADYCDNHVKQMQCVAQCTDF